MAAVKRLAFLSVVLIGVDFLDELGSGIAFVAAPEIQSGFGVSYGQAAGWLLTATLVLSLVLEPPLFVLSERHPRRWFVCGGLAATGLACLLAGFAEGYWVLVAALVVYGPASGCGVGLSQAALMDANPGRHEQLMMRWTLAGSLGDLATPGLLALMVLIGGTWQAGFIAVGVVFLFYAALLWRQPFLAMAAASQSGTEGEAKASLRHVAVSALRDRRLLLWVLAVVLCDLLDEILVAFGALRLREHVGADLNQRAAILTAFAVGGTIGLVLAERLVDRLDPRKFLLVASLACTACYAAWIAAETPLASGVSMFGVGLFSSTHYPVAKAQAYRAFPGRAGTVNAVITAGGWLQLPIPLLIGWVADRAGLGAAVSLLFAQPVGLALICAFVLSRDRSP